MQTPSGKAKVAPKAPPSSAASHRVPAESLPAAVAPKKVRITSPTPHKGTVPKPPQFGTASKGTATPGSLPRYSLAESSAFLDRKQTQGANPAVTPAPPPRAVR